MQIDEREVASVEAFIHDWYPPAERAAARREFQRAGLLPKPDRNKKKRPMIRQVARPLHTSNTRLQ